MFEARSYVAAWQNSIESRESLDNATAYDPVIIIHGSFVRQSPFEPQHPWWCALLFEVVVDCETS